MISLIIVEGPAVLLAPGSHPCILPSLQVSIELNDDA